MKRPWYGDGIELVRPWYGKIAGVPSVFGVCSDVACRVAVRGAQLCGNGRVRWWGDGRTLASGRATLGPPLQLLPYQDLKIKVR